MKRLVLMEGAPSHFTAQPGDSVVSLSPQASYRLDRNQQPYRIVTDFGSEEKLTALQDSYFMEELAWFDQVDSLLAKRLPQLQEGHLDPSILYGYHLKSLLDNLFIRGMELLAILKEKPDRVLWYPAEASSVSPENFLAWSLEHRGVYGRILPHLCKAMSVPLETIQPGPSAKPGHAHGTRMPANIKRRLKEWSWIAQGLFYRRHSDSRQLTLLFLEWGDYLGHLVQAALRKGHRCLILNGGRIVDLSGGGRTHQLPPWRDDICRIALQLNSLAEELAGSSNPIWSWPNRWFGVPAAPLLANPLKGWVRWTLPDFFALSKSFERFYVSQRVDFVLTPFLINSMDFPAVAACRRSAATQSVLLADGDGPDQAPSWDVTELLRQQHYFVPNREFAGYFRHRSRLYSRPTARIHVESSRWKSYTRLARRPWAYLQRWEGTVSLRLNRPPLNVPADRPVILYAAARRETDARYLNRPEYSDTWYYRLQSRLIQLFAGLPEFTFIIKLFPSPDAERTALEKVVEDSGAKNLLISRTPFRRWLPWADRVILDTPSTTLYEAALAGVPFHLLVYRKFPMRPEALSPFSPWLTLFDEPEEAARAVTAYLNKPHSGRPSIPVEDPNVLTTLLQVAETPDSVPAGSQPVLERKEPILQ